MPYDGHYNTITMDIKLISTLLAVQCVALVSPGPDLVLTLRNTVSSGMKSGILSSLGFGTGIFFHAFLALIIIQGAGQFSQEFIPFLGLPGSLYLIYLGIKSWPTNETKFVVDLKSSTAKAPYFEGLLTNLLNPKASLFTIGLITTQVKPDTSISTLATLIAGMVLLTILWFSLVSLTLSRKKLQEYYFRQSRNINYLFSIVFILFGVLLIKDVLDLLLSNLS